MRKIASLVVGLGLAVGALTATPGKAAWAAAKETVQVQAPLDGVGATTREVSLGDLVADAVRQAGGADIALVAADEINETTIPVGSVPADRIVRSLRYAADGSDTVVVLKLTGAQLLKVAERSVSRAPQPFDGFLQVSGLQIRYNASEPEGKRIVLAGAGGGEMDAGHTYRVATTRPVADGSFGYFRLWTKADVVEDTHTTIADALRNYLAAHKTLHVTTENRIATQ